MVLICVVKYMFLLLLLPLLAISLTGTTSDEVPPTNSVPNDKLNDYIPVLITLPVLLIFLISVVIVTVVVTVKIK